MSEYCRKSPKNNQCEPVTLASGTTHVCQPFEVCMPFGRKLRYNGDCLTVEGTPDIADGEYGIIVVKDGCIVTARPNPVPEYTPAPCTPAASPCGGSGGSEGSGVTLQSSASNLIVQDGAGRLGAFLNVEGNGGVTVTGSGTSKDPLVIGVKATEASRTYVQSEDSSVFTVSGTGGISDPYVIGLKETGFAAGTYGSYEFDQYGRLVNYKDAGTAYVNTVVDGPGIKTDRQDSVLTISLADSGVKPNNYQMGGYIAEIDLAGRTASMTRAIQLEAQEFDPHYHLLTVNEFGSITDIQRVSRTPDSQFSKYFGANRTATSMKFSTDTVGQYRIVYKGLLDATITSTTGGFVELPSGYGITIDDDAQECYGWYDTALKKITEVHCISSGSLNAGEHTVALVGPTSVGSRGYMDVSIVRRGS